MNDDHILIRALHGELSAEERAELDERSREDPELARRLATLEKVWSRLEPPASAPVDAGFRDEVVARARRLERTGALLPSPASRIAAILALVAGLGLGLDAGSRPTVADRQARAEIAETLDHFWEESGDPGVGDWLATEPAEEVRR